MNVKITVQRFGNALSSMVLPNIGAFIAWGLITAIFIPSGWFPNKALAQLVDPTVKYLLPLLIGYSGGKLVHGHRGGVVGAVATMGMIVGTDIPMFLGAMIMGPLGGFVIKKFDVLLQGRIRPGFEMLINNFSAGILGGLLAILSFLGVGPLVDQLSNLLAAAVEWLVHTNVLPLASLFIEPAKVLFLNNAINHGVLTPLGVEQVREYGKSMLFLLEANPGPGLGILLAYCLFGKGTAKRSAPGAAIIHFFGGIHEIYFPYILMKPMLFIAAILGGAGGVLTLVTLHGGLLAPASPGSIISILAVTPHSLGNYIANIADVLVSIAISFAVSVVVLKTGKNEAENFEQATEKMEKMKGKKSRAAVLLSSELQEKTQFRPDLVKKVVFACDAGMGSSAMGASLLRKMIKKEGLATEVVNTAIRSLSEDAQVVITQKELTERARQKAPDAYHVSVDHFLDAGPYEQLIAKLKNAVKPEMGPEESGTAEIKEDRELLAEKHIFLNQSFANKEEAIRFAGKVLYESGYVTAGYTDAMLKRDQISTTYIGNGVAIPHGTEEAKKQIKRSGISMIQVPDGVDFDGNTVYLIFGIAGKDGEHLNMLSRIALACSDQETVEKMAKAKSAEELLAYFEHTSETDERYPEFAY
ncbi:PTS mannitol transporter subunit IICBA [Heyndrickxia coagulans]|uniref:Mannitol-specific phosphotransferase enzyme IIA component n=1 Tax=Heyndrickxia coagulans TaxID=1398 RepID=A0A150KDT5_HEYCO|nr:PTS mannitol transporter subunit IICBA [Heyndrickxia coagulans]KYC67861.1 PTS system, mannitol-specific IIB component [Heyndrickxia coagulans]